MTEIESAITICKPIKDLAELYEYMENPPYWAQLTIPISKRSKIVKNTELYDGGNACHFQKNNIKMPARYEYGSVPKTLVCHDMKNGYHDDRYINDTDNYSAYSFYHWAAIDMFVYFSHHFITIPPLGWINVAHKHGVQILGTIITEWQDGSLTCQKFLESEETMQKFVHQLVTIANYFKMDGWLINIENKVDEVSTLLKFVQHLTLKMHHENPDSVVIWYDSVTNTGALDWQNCLNSMNREFFDACDGIFTNYCWKLSHLRRNVEEAGPRRHDVFVGVDVWGRNFWGGGCFNTVEAIKEIHKFDLSMAIFAPAWTHEAIQFTEVIHQQHESKDTQDSKTCSTKSFEANRNSKTQQVPHDTQNYMKCAVKENFILRESALWNSLWPYLNSRGPIHLPFQTFFCQGSGERKKMDGVTVEDKMWFNLREQEYQLSIPLCSKSYLMEKVIETPKTSPNFNSGLEDIDKREKRETTPITPQENEFTETCGQSILITDENNQETTLDCGSHSQINTTCQKSSSDLNTEVCIAESAVQKILTSKLQSPPKEEKAPIQRFKVIPNKHSGGCISIYREDCYQGGSCIKVSPVVPRSSDDLNQDKETIRLLICEFLCDHNFLLYYAVKNINDNDTQDLNLLVSLRNNRSGNVFRVLLTDKLPEQTPEADEIILNPINERDEAVFKKLQKNLLSTHSGFYIPVNNGNKWRIRYFMLNFANSTMLEINCELTSKTGSILLGGLGITKDVVPF